MTSIATPDRPGLFNWFLVVFLGVIWGGAFMSVRLSLDGYPPMTVAAARIGIAALALCLAGRLMGQNLATIGRDAGARGWIYASIVGIGALALPFGLLSWGQQFVPSAFAGVAMGAVPLLVLPLVYVFSPEEGIGPRRIIGMCLGFVGILILVGPGAFDGTSENTLLGRFACLGAAACYAIGSVITRRAPKMRPIAFASASLVAAAAVMIPLALIIDGMPTSFPVTPTQALIYAALFPTALAAVIRVQVITTAGSMFMSMVSYMVPIWSVILGVTLLKEALPQQIYYALAVILLGIAISQSRALADFVKRR